eukprot:6232102-Amphidinium_carterae.1
MPHLIHVGVATMIVQDKEKIAYIAELEERPVSARALVPHRCWISRRHAHIARTASFALKSKEMKHGQQKWRCGGP